MAGKILDLTLKNFMTYDYCKFNFGEHLNIIIGPNGVGKSSIMCAITLALAGKTNIVARATTVGSYIKHGQHEAEIKITLKRNENTKIKITRKITIENRSHFTIDGKSASIKQVEDLAERLNIQINNLCTFLPQDRVQDFAKMDNQSLLENTLKVVGTPELIEQLEELKVFYNKEIKMEKDLVAEKSRLDTEIQKNNSLQIDKENFQKKKNLEMELKYLKQKKKWAKYSLLKENLKNANQHLEDRKRFLGEINKKLEPSQKKQEKLLGEKNKLDKELQSLLREKNEKIKENDTFNKHIKEFKDKINLNKLNYTNHLEDEEKRKLDINNIVKLINTFENEIKKLEDDNYDQIKLEYQTIHDNIKLLSNKKMNLEENKNKLISLKSNISVSIKDLNESLSRLSNYEKSRLNLLENISPDAVSGVQWLRQNRDQFSENIYEPLLLHINVDNKYAKYVENSINRQDLIAFGCTNKQDMNKLLTTLREERDLRINVLHTPDIEEKKSRIPIEHLRKLGLNVYISNLFTAPRPIKSYLLRNYNLHNIPIGNSSAENHVQEINNNHINLFYSDNTRITTKKSKYSSELSSAYEEIKQAYLLSIYVDQKQLETMRVKITDLSNQDKELHNQIQQIDQEINIVKNDITELIEKKRYLSQQIESLEILKGRLRSKQVQLRDLENKKVDLDNLKKEYSTNYNKFLKGILNLLPYSHMELNELQDIHWKMELIYKKTRIIEDLLKEHEISIKELKKSYEEIDKEIRELRGAIKEKEKYVRDALHEAQVETNGLTPNDDDFKKYKKIFEKLPNDIDEINNKIESIRASMDCLGYTNESVLEEFKNREKLINSLNETINNLEKEKNILTASQTEMKNSWIENVNNIVNQVNQSFCQYFAQIKCAGEIQLYIPSEKPNNANEYGLKILVKFRDNEFLQELNRFTQSGGERAISTALYIIAMQSLLKVPFVAVDEINQGMDVDNERHVMNLLVKIASEGTTGQYFLLTPKLIPSIEYNEFVDVVIIHNGAITGDTRLLWGL